MSDREKVINCIKYCINHPLCIDCDACDYGGESSVICDRLIQDTLALLKEQPQWVSVKDRMPMDGQDVLAYMYNGEETRIAPFNYDKGTWYDCVMNCTVAINSITHWMPMPELPEEVSE